MESAQKFGTAIACIDGRFLKRTIDHIELRLGVRHVDTITTAGAVKHLAGNLAAEGEALLANVQVSLQAHSSLGTAIVAHGECAGNPVPDRTQKEQLASAVETLTSLFPDMDVSAFFLDPKTGFFRIP
ncbi:MAG: carbonic anhydrase [Acidimicrobiia bacterium]